MCYSAQIEASIKKMMREWNVTVDYAVAEAMFLRRLNDPRIKIPKAFEANFDRPNTPEEQRVKDLIEQYRARTETQLQQDVFKQAKRLADAERSLQSKDTKKAREEVRIATAKIDANRERLARLRAPDLNLDEQRIFPFHYAPVIVNTNGVNVLTLARYHLRQKDSPEFVDRKYPGLYNARRDNLEKFWRNEFGHSHALMLVSSFFENVEREGKNVVLHFNPRPAQTMLIACLYSAWTSPTEGEIRSFAAVTDEPPAEIAAAGHDRCIVNIQPGNVERWLTPEGRSTAELQAILDDRQQPYYEHAIAA
ncbi:MAG: SOS response-associated peptidase family protein [Povalibacter sp.]